MTLDKVYMPWIDEMDLYPPVLFKCKKDAEVFLLNYYDGDMDTLKDRITEGRADICVIGVRE